MPIEWAAISAAVVPFLKNYARRQAEKLADSGLGEIYRRVVPDEKRNKANDAFVTRFGKELESAMDLPTLQAGAYQDALEAFLCNDSVQDAIQAPLDGQSELDGELLRGMWYEVRTSDGAALMGLPEEFDWGRE